MIRYLVANPCWQSRRSDVSCSWQPGLHKSQVGFVPLLFTDPLQVIKVSLRDLIIFCVCVYIKHLHIVALLLF